MKPLAEYGQFAALDLRVGRVVKVEDSRATKPTYRLTIDLGPELGTRVSIGAFRKYTKEELTGRLVVCIVNLGDKRMGPETSQVFTLGVDDPGGQVAHLTVDGQVQPGQPVY